MVSREGRAHRAARALAMGLVVGLCAGMAWPTMAGADDASSRIGITVVDGRLVTAVIAALPRVGDASAISRYHDSGRFDGDRAGVAQAARTALNLVVAERCPGDPAGCSEQGLAIIVDIDDTLVDWYPQYARAGFSMPSSVRQAAVQSCATPVIAPVRALVQQAQRQGVAVLIVSGRRDTVRAVTESCLERRGVRGWDDLVLRTAAQDALPAATYKRRAARALMQQGWVPVLSIGDQAGDLTGSADTERFWLPNPLYTAR
ncbi:MAG: HAD family acid phosphatase [Actinomycetota bacterium]|nr:HAD family acid phosphatase [Actinomycetota bacterium]